MTTATVSPLAIGIGALETLAHELHEAGLEPAQFSWNSSDSTVTGGATFQFHTAEETDRARLLLFGAAVEPTDERYSSLLSYAGVRGDGIRLYVFGPRCQ